MPYIDINPHKKRVSSPMKYVGLGVLLVVTVAVVVLALNVR